MLRQLCDERAENLQLELAIERKLSSAETWRAIAEHNLMEPSAVPDADHQHQLSLADIHCISAIHYPHLDFSESSLSTEEMEMVIQAIQSQAITPVEQARLQVGSIPKALQPSPLEESRASRLLRKPHFLCTYKSQVQPSPLL